MAKTNMFDPNSFVEGGGNFSLAGVEGIVVSSIFKHTNWAKEDGSIPTYKKGPNKGEPVKPSTIWEIEVKRDDVDTPVKGTISVSGVLMPSKDGVTQAKDLEGPFLVHPEGKDVNIVKNSGIALFTESLVNASFDYDQLNEQGTDAIMGYRILFDEVQRKDNKGADIGSPTTVVTKLIHGPGTSTKAAKAKVGGIKAAPVKAAVGKVAVKAKPAPEPEPTEEEGEIDMEATVTEIITNILAETSPLPKSHVSMKVNKELGTMGLEQPVRMAMLKLALSEDFLAAGPWTYDKKSLAAIEAE